MSTENITDLLIAIKSKRAEIEELRTTLIEKEKDLHKLETCLKCSTGGREIFLTNEEIARYSRQLILPGFGVESQLKLKQLAVLIVGAGGLGCPAGQYLAATGVGKIGFVDYDEVDRSNLHRQILHNASRIGWTKVESARRVIEEINPNISVLTFKVLANSENILDIIKNDSFDIVLDCTDNVATRYLLNDACVLLKKPLVSGSALQLDGQLTVYNYGECCPCYRCLFPVPPPPEAVTNCGDGGVFGAVTGVIGTLQALETIKIATQLGEVLAGRLLLFDGARSSFRNIKLRGRRIDCEVCSTNPIKAILEDYEEFCGMRASDKDFALSIFKNDERISVKDYEKIRDQPHLLIDVRSVEEFGICRLPDSKNVPLKEVLNDEFIKRFENDFQDPKLPIFILCRRGNDSQLAVQHLRNKFSQHNIRDIIGGLHAWHYQIDINFPIY